MRAETKHLAEANDWLERYRRTLEANFQRLDALLVEMKAEEKKHRRVTKKTRQL